MPRDDGRHRQPGSGYGLRVGGGLLRGIVGVIAPDGATWAERIKHRPVVHGGQQTQNDFGVGRKLTGSNGVYPPTYRAWADWEITTTPHAFAMMFELSSFGGTNGFGGNTNGSQGYYIGQRYSDGTIMCGIGGANNISGVTPVLKLGKRHVAVVTYDGSTAGTLQLYLDGNFITSASGYTTGDGYGSYCIPFLGSSGVTGALVGTVYWGALWARALTREDALELAARPWQFWQPDQGWEPSYVSGGAAVVESSAASRLRVRGAAGGAKTASVAAAERLYARSADAVVPIKTTTASERVLARATGATSKTAAAVIVGRGVRVRSVAVAAPVGAVNATAATRLTMRTATATAAIKATAPATRVRARGADAHAKIATAISIGRAGRVRSASSAAPAGINTTSAAARVRARTGAAVATIKVSAGACAVRATCATATAKRILVGASTRCRAVALTDSAKRADVVAASRARVRSSASAGPPATTLPNQIGHRIAHKQRAIRRRVDAYTVRKPKGDTIQ